MRRRALTLQAIPFKPCKVAVTSFALKRSIHRRSKFERSSVAHFALTWAGGHGPGGSGRRRLDMRLLRFPGLALRRAPAVVRLALVGHPSRSIQ